MVQVNKTGQTFNADDHGEMNSFSGLPADTYLMRIIASEMKPNSAKTGAFLEIDFSVIQGKFEGRRFLTRLNLDNPNSTAVQIANEELGAICRACGKPVIMDSVELHGIPLLVTLDLEPPKAASETKSGKARGPNNVALGYKAASNPAATTQAPNAQTSVAADPAAQTSSADPIATAAEVDEKPPWA